MARTTDSSGAGTPPPEDEVVGYVEPIEINLEMERSFLEYSMSVIVSRALPDVRDGLKPVHRRILYAMRELNFTPDRPYNKSARAVGETMGNYHPHGNLAIYDDLVRMVQDFSPRLRPIVTPKCGCSGSRCQCSRISTKTPSIFGPIMTRRNWSRSSCRLDFP